MSKIDKAKSKAFAQQMITTLNNAAIALMTSIGYQTGLFDTMATLPPSSSSQIAEAAGLNERYVREWLGAMVTGQVIEHHPAAETYHLPAEHAAWLTRSAGTHNLAMDMQYIPLLASVEEGIIESFQHGGGIPYSAYPRFQQIMAEDSAARFDKFLLTKTLPLLPGLVDRLQTGIKVADVGCGQGHAINLMAQAFPNSHFVGYDFSKEGVAVGQAEAQQLGLSNAHFEAKDVTALGLSNEYDFITAFDTIHDQAQPALVLASIAQALRPDGVFLMVDIAASSQVSKNLDHILGPFFYTVSCMHCMTVSLALDGAGLGAMWGEELALQMLTEAGFTQVDVQKIKGDLTDNYYIAMKTDLAWFKD